MKKNLLLLLAIFLIFSSCNKKNKFKIDVSGIDLKIEIIRFEKEFCSIKAQEIYSYIPRWQKQYGEFWEIYNYAILQLGSPESSQYLQKVKDFFSYCRTLDIESEVEKVFPEQDDFLETSLTQAFKHYKYYFPQKKIPVIYTTITGFNTSVYVGNEFIGISLDKYLGKNFALYKDLGFERYLRRRMYKEMLPVDVMRAWIVSEYPYNDSVNNVLSKMIYEGRVQYFLRAMFPDAGDTLLWNYTENQLKWAEMYENKIWDYLVNKKVLFDTKNINIKRFTGEAAFTPAFGQHSAPRAAVWIGYKIVERFMENNPQITLEELMEINDYMTIYNLSYYEP